MPEKPDMTYYAKLEQHLIDTNSRIGSMGKYTTFREAMIMMVTPSTHFPGSESAGPSIQELYAKDSEAGLERFAEIIFNIVTGVTPSKELPIEALDNPELWAKLVTGED